MKAIAAFVCLCMFASSAAFGNLPVIDGSNLTQNTVSAINNLTTAAKTTAAYAQQIQQYKTQLNQYADQVKNSLAPVTSVWQNAQGAISSVLSTVNAYKSIGTDLQSYLGRFQDTNYWMSAPSSAYQLQTTGPTAQMKANAALMRGILQQQDQLRQDAASLQQLQGMAATAEGRMQALQYANQLATLQAKQLMDVRALLIQAQIAEATRNQTLANDEAMRQAADAKFFGGTLQNKAANGYKP